MTQVVSRVQDTLIWVMKAEDFDDEEKMQGFQAMVTPQPDTATHATLTT